ncbi:C45 family autoproteolytic acyltransferase/hydolase [Mucisphaera calidilacus]|uniref:Acyl-coenzyme A:6-aminopenicillanic acid acyl-transferase n=1 Tax=Mucisphaera calidilacus TaxID=2527982 RepID=A0A518C174_9BACT|nr:C45 family peptidase [Mucisphaera calidilacus]QDU72972.1 Acyl-coenzyme A:6-aminopenicillanic acid acyl-transferase [Mucisphaera calidilacus]
MSRIQWLGINGTPYKAGLAHGQAYASEIAAITRERMELLHDPYWTQGGATPDVIRDLGEQCLEAQNAYDPDMTQELKGIADGAGIDTVEALIMNGFTDFVDVVFAARGNEPVGEEGGGCTAALVSTTRSEHNQPYFAQTWDMHPTATPHVRMVSIERDNEPSVITFTLAGCVGMIGMNDAGVCVGINNFLVEDGRPGVTWVFVVRAMLRQTTAEAAHAELERADLCGAHNYLLLGPSESGGWTGWNIEATPTRKAATHLEDILLHTNHCLADNTHAVQRAKHPTALACSQTRLADADELINTMPAINAAALRNLLATRRDDGMGICHDAMEGYKVETSGAVVMDPAERQLWACWGRPDTAPWEHFAFNEHGVRRTD